MTEFDLDALSAPIKALAPEIDAAYARLGKKWASVADELLRLNLPCPISHSFAEHPDNPCDCMCLEFRKWKGQRRLCIASYSAGDRGYGWEENCDEVVPFEEWSGEQRVAMLKHIPNLFKAAERQVRAFIDQTKL